MGIPESGLEARNPRPLNTVQLKIIFEHVNPEEFIFEPLNSKELISEWC